MRQEHKNFGKALDDEIDTERRLRLIIDTTPALIYSARSNGYIDFFNQQCLEFLGLPFEEISGWEWTKTIHADDLEPFLAKWRAALKTGEPFLAESRVRRADGQYRCMLHRHVALVDDQKMSSGGLVRVSILTIKNALKRLCDRKQMSCGEASSTSPKASGSRISGVNRTPSP